MCRYRPFLILFAFFLLLSGCNSPSLQSESSAAEVSQEPKIEYEIIQSPYSHLSNNARNVWDMRIFEGSLYIGAGDYDLNVSPSAAYRYDLADKKWYTCGAIPDEQIHRFCIIDGGLYIPGCDPTGDWSLGNYYKLEDKNFVTHRVIPQGIHCFDLVGHENKLFAALGYTSESTEFPVAVSEDGGKSFKNLKHSGGSKSDVRVYKLFSHGGELYALNGVEIYRYDGEKFIFEASWKSGFVAGYPYYTRIGESAYFKGRTYFTTGYLFHFEDVKNLQYTIFENAIVTDLAVYGDKLYVLCAKPLENGNYLICLTVTEDGKSFETVKTVEYGLPALSFELDGTTLYLGIGDISTIDDARKGEILKTEVPE